VLRCSYKIGKSVSGEGFLHLRPGKALNQIADYVGANAVQLILNRVDSYVSLHGKLASHFGCFGPSATAIEKFRNKASFHKLLVAENMARHRPKTEIVLVSELEEHIKTRVLPVVIKPFIGANSQAVVVIEKLSDLYDHMPLLVDHFSKNRAANTSGLKHTFLVEDYISGQQLTPCAYVDHVGKITLLDIIDIVRARDLGLEGTNIHYRTTMPKLSNSVVREITQILEKIATSSGLTSTFIDPEFIVTKEGIPFIIEVNPRIGGFRYEMMRYAFGLDTDLISIQLAMGEKVTAEKKFKKYCTGVEIWDTRSGTLSAFVIPDDPSIVEVQQSKFEGDKYLAPPLGNASLGKLFVVADSGTCLETAKKIRNKLTLEFEKNKKQILLRE